MVSGRRQTRALNYTMERMQAALRHPIHDPHQASGLLKQSDDESADLLPCCCTLWYTLVHLEPAWVLSRHLYASCMSLTRPSMKGPDASGALWTFFSTHLYDFWNQSPGQEPGEELSSRCAQAASSLPLWQATLLALRSNSTTRQQSWEPAPGKSFASAQWRCRSRPGEAQLL